VDVVQPRTRGGLAAAASSSNTAGLFKKLNGMFSSQPSQEDLSASWVSSWNLPSDESLRINPTSTSVLNLLKQSGGGDKSSSSLIPLSTSDFLRTASEWSKQFVPVSPSLILYPYGTDFINPRAIFPDSKSYLLLNSWFIPKIAAVKQCSADEKCLELAKEFARVAFQDLEREGFVTTNTLSTLSGTTPLGILPALLASIYGLQAQILHIEEAPAEVSLSCLKFFLKTQEQEFVSTYCGNLDESSDEQRTAIRNVLKPLHDRGVFMRNSNYLLNPKVRDTLVVSLAHFEALILGKSSVVVQDDSGIPFSVLNKHASELIVYGTYRGLGQPELSGLEKVKGSVVKSLYQPELALIPSSGPLPFKFGYRNVIEQRNKINTNHKNVFVHLVRLCAPFSYCT
jgi:hypothetical protein